MWVLAKDGTQTTYGYILSRAELVAIEADAAEPYRRVVEAAQDWLREGKGTQLVELKEAVAALPVSEAERA